jgi:hypothetical protein
MTKINNSAIANSRDSVRRRILLLVIACALTIFVLWKALTPKYFESIFSQASDTSIRKSASNNEKLIEPTRTISTTEPVGITPALAQRGAQLGLFDKPVRALIDSNSLAKIDYAIYRIRPQCSSVTYNSNGIKPIEDNFSATAISSFGEGALNFGRATKAARYAAYARSIEKCSKLYEASSLSQQEVDALDSRPMGREYAALRETLFAHDVPKDFDSTQMKVAVEKIASEPMFGLLSRLLLSHLEYEPLTNSYKGNVLPEAFPDIVTTLVLCRMGDDCGQGGIVTEQLCWLNAICGSRAEDAIMANLVERGIDVTTLNEYVSRVHRALQTQDTSVFRKPKK